MFQRESFGLHFLLAANSVSNPGGPATATASWKICDQEPLIRLGSSSSCPIKSSSSSILIASDCRRRLTSLTGVRVFYQIVISNTNSKDDNHFSKALAWLSCSLIRPRFSNACLRAAIKPLGKWFDGVDTRAPSCHRKS